LGAGFAIPKRAIKADCDTDSDTDTDSDADVGTEGNNQ
jgi:hypothetical protein